MSDMTWYGWLLIICATLNWVAVTAFIDRAVLITRGHSIRAGLGLIFTVWAVLYVGTNVT